MSSIARPPEPCLVAIILIVRSRGGPRFVYHYPPSPTAFDDTTASSSSASNKPRHSRSKNKTKGTDSSQSSDEDGSSSDEDNNTNAGPASSTPVAGGGAAAGGTATLGRSGSDLALSSGASSAKDSHRSSSGTHSSTGHTHLVLTAPQPKRVSKTASSSSDAAEDSPSDTAAGTGDELFQPPWETLLGLQTYVWEKLLSPSPAWHKRKFEVGINDLTFVGWPVFVREDGTWRKRRRKKVPKEDGVWDGAEIGEEDGSESEQRDDKTSELEGSVIWNGKGKVGDIAAAEGKAVNAEQAESADCDKDAMTMFNVVFVLNPPTLEYNLRVREKYDNVIKKFGKGLKSEQARKGYVWTEAQTILHIKEKGRENRWSLNNLYSELLSKSSLARAISTLYTCISSSRIASITLTPETTMSLQIPPLTSTPYLPTGADTAYPGLWLTTADSLSAADEVTSTEASGPNQVLAKHFALLLLSDEATILKDIEASMGTLGPPLAHYIRSSKPTKSFAQISAQSSIPLSDIQVLASHLAYWRRARAVPPLNKGDTYIVSPNCDMSKLSIATAAYAAAFPTMPSLPKMLSVLSSTPRPYFTLIPSRDHKEIYYSILAWLLRGGWVTQLRTFGWVKVTPKTKIAVEEAMAREEEERESEEGSENKTATSSVILDDDSEAISDDDEDGRASSSSSSLDSESSGDGDATPVPGRYHRQQQKKRAEQQQQQQQSSPSQQRSRLHRNHHHHRHSLGPIEPYTSSLILHPHRASPLESRWLDHILSTFPDDHGPSSSSSPATHLNTGINTTTTSEPSSIQETTTTTTAATEDSSNPPDSKTLQKYWPIFTRYFNGTDALEKIPVREALSRKVVWRLLNRLDVNSRASPQGQGQGQGQVHGQAQQGQGQYSSSSAAAAEAEAREKVVVTVRHW